MKKDTQNGMKRVNTTVDQMAVFVIIKNVGVKQMQARIQRID